MSARRKGNFLCVIWNAWVCGKAIMGSKRIAIDTSKVIATGRGKAVGININYIRDADANRNCRPLAEALKDMGVKRLRFPGGEKSNWHFFAKPPFEKCESTTYNYYLERMNESVPMTFDMFMEIVYKTGDTPHVNVPLHLTKESGIPMETYVEHAARWVHYSNIKNKYGVKYWEIGNENYLKKFTPEDAAKYVKIMSKAMKSEDPSIKICASGNQPEWWEIFLPLVKDDIDVLTCSEYFPWEWKGYEYFEANDDLPFTPQADYAAEAIRLYAPERMGELEVVISELNSMDYAENGWPPYNNLGHSLATFNQLGVLHVNSKISYGMLWNTRWMDQEEQHKHIFYGLDYKNEPLPSGMSVKLWGCFARDNFVKAWDEGGLVVFACKDTEGITIFILNKHGEEAHREIIIDGKPADILECYCYGGTNPDDLRPEFKIHCSSPLVCPPYSVIVVVAGRK